MTASEVVSKGAMAPTLSLRDSAATDSSVAGAKAANLARAAAKRLPVLDGEVITVSLSVELARREPTGAEREVLRSLWERLSNGSQRPLVVRSSATIEDSAQESMAGLFTSVLDVGDFDSFLRAVRRVASSGAELAEWARREEQPPVAVLVQPQLESLAGGVLFSADPVSGDRDAVVVAVGHSADDVVRGVGPERQYRLRRGTGSVEREDGPPGAPSLTGAQRSALVRLARRAERAFGVPQDVEWAIDSTGDLWLLQSRPITTAMARSEGPLFGVGPVAETFPDALAPLEEDLWVEPLRKGLGHAMVLSGAASRRRVRRSEVVVSIDGQVAADLDLLAPKQGRFSSALHPLAGLRRMAAAWRVGRLHHAFPTLARSLIGQADADLAGVPALETLSDHQLLRLLRRSRSALVSLHSHEALAGLFIRGEGGAPTAAGEALGLVEVGRRRGLDDEAIVRAHPVALALVPPRVGGSVSLPPTAELLGQRGAPDGPGGRIAVLREALRLRARWVQELSSRAAWELGERLLASGSIREAEQVRRLRLDELEELVRTGRSAMVIDGQVTRDLPHDSPPLPARFHRLGTTVVAVSSPGGGDAIGAGGGAGEGVVHHLSDGPPPTGAVLVVRSLEPRLAGLLPGLAGLVAETGSALSHVAILAREMAVPAVVSLDGALELFPPGTRVRVDGARGEVAVIDGAGYEEES